MTIADATQKYYNGKYQEFAKLRRELSIIRASVTEKEKDIMKLYEPIFDGLSSKKIVTAYKVDGGYSNKYYLVFNENGLSLKSEYNTNSSSIMNYDFNVLISASSHHKEIVGLIKNGKKVKYFLREVSKLNKRQYIIPVIVTRTLNPIKTYYLNHYPSETHEEEIKNDYSLTYNNGNVILNEVDIQIEHPEWSTLGVLEQIHREVIKITKDHIKHMQKCLKQRERFIMNVRDKYSKVLLLSALKT